jgi:hypothetical protein
MEANTFLRRRDNLTASPLLRRLRKVAAHLRVDTDVVERARQDGDGERAGLGAGSVVALEIPALSSGGYTNDEPDEN